MPDANKPPTPNAEHRPALGVRQRPPASSDRRQGPHANRGTGLDVERAPAPEAALADRAAAVAARLRIAHGVDAPTIDDADPIGELVGTILGQHTSDSNSARAYRALRAAYPTWNDVVAAPEHELADAIRSGGLANIKARRIQECLRAITASHGALSLAALRQADLPTARAALRALPGVGPKTAACILLFALGQPAIPVDTHVHRVSRRLGLIGPTVSAERAHDRLAAIVAPADAYAFHVGLVRHGRRVCKAGQPLCRLCPLTDLCDYHQHGGSHA